MTPIRKKALVWILSLSAITVLVISVSYIYLRDAHPSDSTYIETHLSFVAEANDFELEDARTEYTDEEITEYLVKHNRAEFDHLWRRIFLIVGSIYFAACLVVGAVMLWQESRHRQA